VDGSVRGDAQTRRFHQPWQIRGSYLQGDGEIGQLVDADDFAEEFTPELREREERQRPGVEENARRRAA
jgi:hypothetical protein